MGAIPIIVLPPVGAALVTMLGGVQSPDALRIYFLLSLVRIGVLSTYFLSRTTETLEARPGLSGGISAVKEFGRDLRELLAVKRVRLYFGYAMVSAFAAQLVGPFQVIVIYEVIGASPVFIGFMTSISAVTAYLAMNLGAVWSDRIGRKKPILVASGLSAVGWAFFLFAGNERMLVPFYVMTSLAALAAGAGSALAMEYVPTRMRGRWYGTLSFVTLIPGCFAPILGGWLFDTFSPRAPYYVFYLLSFLVVVPYFVKFIPETMSEAQAGGRDRDGGGDG